MVFVAPPGTWGHAVEQRGLALRDTVPSQQLTCRKDTYSGIQFWFNRENTPGKELSNTLAIQQGECAGAKQCSHSVLRTLTIQYVEYAGQRTCQQGVRWPSRITSHRCLLMRQSSLLQPRSQQARRETREGGKRRQYFLPPPQSWTSATPPKASLSPFI